MPSIRIAVAALGLLLPTVPGLAAEAVPVARSIPAAPLIAGHFRLATTDGKSVDSDDLAGKPYGVFFGFTQLPGWMQDVSSVFPLKWMAQGMRSVFLPEQFQAQEVSGSWEHGATALVIGAYLVLGLVLGARTFRWRRRDDG